jgi:hypothetical protein
MLEGGGDAFRLHQTQVFYGESREGDLKNRKLGTVSSPKPDSLN